MFRYNVVIGTNDCINCPFEFDFLEDCLDSACDELRTCEARYYPSLDFEAFIYCDAQLIKRVDYINGDVFEITDCN